MLLNKPSTANDVLSLTHGFRCERYLVIVIFGNFYWTIKALAHRERHFVAIRDIHELKEVG